jgi:hypothetical protein
MVYPLGYEKTYFCASLERRRARSPGGGPPLVRCFRPPSVPNSAGQLQRRERLPDRQRPRVQPADCAQRHPRLQRARTSREALRRGSKRPHTIHRAFDSERAEALRELLHHKPRKFGKGTSLWTLDLAADVSFEEGLTKERVSGETIRATLARLGVRWERAKRWISSPDPEYARKKGGATG